MSPCAKAAEHSVTAIQTLCGHAVTIKNTFLDDWDDEAYAEKRRASRRLFRTMPDLIGYGCSEPEPEVSPTLAAAEGIRLPPPAVTAPPGAPQCRGTALAAGRSAFEGLLDWLPSDEAPECPGTGCRAEARGGDGEETRQTPAAIAGLPLCRARPALGDEYMVEDDDLFSPVPRAGGQCCGALSKVSPAPAKELRHYERQGPDGSSDRALSPGPPGGGVLAGSAAKPAQPEKRGRKLSCHLYLNEGMLDHAAFNMNKKIIGHGGNLTKRIFTETGAKIRLRGRGSQHKEGGGKEAPVPLMLAVALEEPQQDDFVTAVKMAADLLRVVENKFSRFCLQRGLPAPADPCFWVGELSPAALECLAPVLGDLPAAPAPARGGRARRHTWAATAPLG